MSLNLIVAVSQNGVIGQGLELPWRLRKDLQHFKELTMGSILLMGRRTFQSLPGLLPGRTHAVVSSSLGKIPGAHRFRSPEQALRTFEGKTIFVIGGAQLYRALERQCENLYITEVRKHVPVNAQTVKYTPDKTGFDLQSSVRVRECQTEMVFEHYRVTEKR